MDDQKCQLLAGQTVGDEDGLGAIFTEPPIREGYTRGVANVRMVFAKPVLLACYAWTSTLSEMYLDLKTIDEFRFSCLFHFVVDTPVAAATDHPQWQDDVALVFSLYTQTDAFITSITHMFRRGCGRYLHEVPDLEFVSQVAWPIKNLEYMKIGGTFKLRVTAC